MNAGLPCVSCGEPIPAAKIASAKHCSNKCSKREQQRRRNARHPEMARASARRWYAANPEKARAHERQRVHALGDRFYLSRLPDEWRDVAIAVREARALIRQQRTERVNG